jgi:hypothetical protein
LVDFILADLTIPLQVIRSWIFVLPLWAEWTDISRRTMHQTMPDHLILSLEALSPLRSRAAFYRTIMRIMPTVAVTDTQMTSEKVLLDVSERLEVRG